MHPHLRLRRSDDFRRLRNEGQTRHHAFMILSYARNDLPHNRYGFITGKRLGNAVIRNRHRRLLREAMRQLHPTLKSGYDMVLIARPAIVGQPFTAILHTTTKLCHKAHLTNTDQS